MNTLQRWLMSLLLILGCTGAMAQVPVTDAAHIAVSIEKDIKDVIAWAEQQYQMVEADLKAAEQIYHQLEQIQHLQTVIQNASGVRGFGEVLNAIGETDLVPDDLADAFQKTQDFTSYALQAKALTQGGLKSMAKRQKQIRELMKKINETVDEKGIAEVNARIQAETAQVMAESNQLGLVTMMRQDQEKQLINDMLARRQTEALDTRRTTVDFSSDVVRNQILDYWKSGNQPHSEIVQQ